MCDALGVQVPTPLTQKPGSSEMRYEPFGVVLVSTVLHVMLYLVAIVAYKFAYFTFS